MAAPISVIHDSTFVSNLDLHEPQILNTLFQPYGDQGKSYLRIRSMGFERPVAGDYYEHWEEDFFHDTFVQLAGANVVQNVAGATAVLTLDPSKIDAEGNFYVREQDDIVLKNEVACLITDITVTPNGLGTGIPRVDVTILPHDETMAVGTVNGGTELGIFSAVFSEGSGMPDPAASKVRKRGNEAQIIKEAIGVTGTELVNETRIEIFNKAGEYQGYYRQGQAGLDYRMLLKLDGMFWTSQRITNVVTPGRAIDPVTKRKFKATEGVFPTLRRLGHTAGYTPGAYAVSEFDVYDTILEREGVSTDIPNWTALGHSLYQEVENELVTYLANTNISYTRQSVNDKLFKGNEALGMSVNFTYVQKSSRTYLLDKLSGFSNQKTYGITGYKYPKMGVIIPLTEKKDPRTGGMIPTIGMRYRSMGAYQRRMITGRLDGIGAVAPGGIPVNTIDASNTYQLAHMGVEIFGANQMILIDPV